MAAEDYHNMYNYYDARYWEQFEERDEEQRMTIENVKCPDCDGPMVSRFGIHGTFWGCKNYPDCRGTRDSMGRSKAERATEREQEKDKKENRRGW